MSHRRRPQPLDKAIAGRVRKLHREHENLGHEGILRLLKDEGIVVDEHELRVFMDENKLDAGPTATWHGDKNPLRHIPHPGGAIHIGDQ